MPSDELLRKMREMKEKELDHEEGKIFAYSYTLNDDHYAIQKDVFNMFTGVWLCGCARVYKREI